MAHFDETKGRGGPAATEEPVRRPVERVTPAAARYLEAVYYMLHEGETVRPGRLAEWLGVSPPTVTAALHRLARDGLVTLGADRTVRFTEAGETAAVSVVRRHRVAECWLTQELGFDWATADAEAEKVAHSLSDIVLDRLYERLGSPATCPHGNAIPGRGGEGDVTPLVSLDRMVPGGRATVTRISELAEHEAPEVLGILDSEGLVPGAEVVLEPASGDPGILRVRVGGRLVHVSTGTASVVWVRVA